VLKLDSESKKGIKRLKKKLLFGLLVVILIVLFYFPGLNHEPIWDSREFINNNIIFNTETSLAEIFSSGYWETFTEKSIEIYEYYRPLLLSFFARSSRPTRVIQTAH